MTPALRYLVWATLLTWVMLLVASLVRTNGWTSRGLLFAFGNRDDLPEASALAGRAERAARNMLENLVLFAALVLTAHAVAPLHPRATVGAAIFFWARLAYAPIYWAGLRYLRTGVWAVSVAGLAMIVSVLI